MAFVPLKKKSNAVTNGIYFNAVIPIISFKWLNETDMDRVSVVTRTNSRLKWPWHK